MAVDLQGRRSIKVIAQDTSSTNRKQELLELFLPYRVELEETRGGWMLTELDFFLNDDGVRAVAKVIKMARDGNVCEFLFPQRKSPWWYRIFQLSILRKTPWNK